MRLAAGNMDRPAASTEVVLEIGREARFPDTGCASQDNSARVALFDFPANAAKQFEFCLASYQGSRALNRSDGSQLGFALDDVHSNGVALAFNGDGLKLPRNEARPGVLYHTRGGHDLAAFRGAHESRGEVNRISDDRVLSPVIRTHIARVHEPCVDTNAVLNAKTHLGEETVQLERQAQGVGGVVFPRHRRAKGKDELGALSVDIAAGKKTTKK